MGTVMRSACNRCGGYTDHDVLHEDTISNEGADSDWRETKKFALSCRGCHDWHLRIEERYFSLPSQFNNPAEVAPTVSFKPPRLWRHTPGWMDQLEEIDPDLSDLLKQVYSAANDEQTKLLSMGIRAALDHVMIKMLGGDFGGFEQKLSQMVEQGHLTPSQKENLEIVIDAGSASSHRGYRPPRDLINSMMMTMETLIQTHYITGPMLQTARGLIPPRPPRQRLRTVS